MTLIQEAYALMQEQPEGNIRLIIELLHTMSQKETVRPFKRTGIANGTVDFPEDFDDCFDGMDEEIAEMFYGGES